MNGIDTVVASLLASRVDSLLSGNAAGDATASQTGASALTVDTPAVPLPLLPGGGPQASAQTALSAVALTLDAIVRSGGEATPAVVGQTPVWPTAPVPLSSSIPVASAVRLSVPLPLFDGASSSSAASSDAAATGSLPNASASTVTQANASAAVSAAAAQWPVAALAAALEQTVADSGLFYEAHLVQWLAGQRSPASLAGEPQNRLATAAQQLPLDWAGDADASAWPVAAALLRAGVPLPSSLPSGSQGSPQTPPPGTPQNASPLPMQTSAQTAAQTAAQAAQAGAPGLAAAHSQAGANLPPASLRLLADAAALATPSHGAAHQAAADQASQADPAQSIAASIHAATIPLVRQQLDLLATGQFRWTGEAWPGARLDWTIEQDDDGRGREGSDSASSDDIPWRTRLTLSLPTLGTVDAELTLTGTQLFARVQASPGGATRLAAHGESFRQRLAAVGIDLGALSIREIGGGATAMNGTEAESNGMGGSLETRDAPPRVTPQAAANAYARSASAADEAARAASAAQSDRPVPLVDDFDWDMR
ncbi:flagellar hook-length control protein FliK [Paraburkholderia sp.]|uniref:flagellar hook-length control protein FliK n=1 Tax=Paraburkholderia sp. TaxID=1926495 RepID=UPI003D6F185D